MLKWKEHSPNRLLSPFWCWVGHLQSVMSRGKTQSLHWHGKCGVHTPQWHLSFQAVFRKPEKDYWYSTLRSPAYAPYLSFPFPTCSILIILSCNMHLLRAHSLHPVLPSTVQICGQGWKWFKGFLKDSWAGRTNHESLSHTNLLCTWYELLSWIMCAHNSTHWDCGSL